MAVLHLDQGRKEKAVTSLKMALGLDSAFAPARMLLQKLDSIP